jgi:hypothetical protein
MTRALNRLGWLALALIAIASNAHADRPAPGASASVAATASASASVPKELVERQIERIKQRAHERARNRKQRQVDIRRSLRDRLAKRLAGRPITAAIRAELELYARRVARIRRIRFVAAEANDWEMVERADRTLAREHARHEKWWRTAPELAEKPEPAAKAGASTAAKEAR